MESDTTTTHRLEWEAIVPVAMTIWVLLLAQINNVRMLRLLARSRGPPHRKAMQPTVPTKPGAGPIRLEPHPSGRSTSGYAARTWASY